VLTIAPFEEQHAPAVREFNRRLQAGGAPADYVFSESPVPEWLPPGPGAPVYNRFYIALEDGIVRGAYAVKHQEFLLGGERREIAYYHHPLSEGVIDRKFAMVGVQMLIQAQRQHPLIYALGMDGTDQPLPRMLAALKWPSCAIPFFFKVNHPTSFLRNMRPLRASAARRALADAAAATGAGWAAFKGVQFLAGLPGAFQRAEAEEVAEFGEWADEIWRDCVPHFRILAVRDGCTLRTLFPAGNPNFIRLKVTARGRLLGWAALGDVRKQAHPQYGSLRVGTILDGLARPQDAAAVVSAAARVLEMRGVDVITSNQSHYAWRRALRRCGFLPGPSNFIFAASPELSRNMMPFDETILHSHWTRGDGDNLLQYVRPV